MKRKLYLFFVVFIVYCFFAYQWTKHLGPIIIYSEPLLNIASLAMGMEPVKAKGVALPPPLIALRRKDHEMNASRTKHERIHHLQMTESLFLLPLYSQLEILYAKRVLNKNDMEAYLRKTTEQEAYLNQDNLDYIQNRKLRSSLGYISNKVAFSLEDYQVVIK